MSAASVTTVGAEARLGFYGKLPARGDFIGRRLDAGFVEVWHGWVEACMACSREQLGKEWQARYLSAPLWRVLIGPAICGPAAFAGVLMASVDRIGRCFPLLLAIQIGAPLDPLRGMREANQWFAEIEDLALSGLVEDLDPEAFDLAAAKVAPHDFGPAGEAGLGVVLPQEPIAGLTASLLADLVQSYSLWTTIGAPGFAPVTVACRGLPSPQGFAALLDGDWSRWGWKIP